MSGEECVKNVITSPDQAKITMQRPVPMKRTRRANSQLNNDSLSLEDTLLSFNGPIGKEQAWAVCHQTAKALYQLPSNHLQELTSLNQILLHKDGYIFLNLPHDSQTTYSPEKKVIFSLGLLIYKALDFRLDQNKERDLSADLTELMCLMTNCDEDYEPEERLHETDDEGIGRDSEAESDDVQENTSYSNSLDYCTLKHIIQVCNKHIQETEENSDKHYRNVIRTFVHEALAERLNKVAAERFQANLKKLQGNTGARHVGASSQHVDTLDIDDWARFWVQVIGELRRGTKLKNVEANILKRGRTISRGAEFELTPYEVLMNDIRERKYHLKKTAGPSRNVQKDAHDVILDFVRSRPPLKKASERQLAPMKKQSTIRELLMESIRKPPRPLKSFRDRQLEGKKNVGGEPRRIVLGEVPPARAEQEQEQEPAQDVAAQWRQQEGQGSCPIPQPRPRTKPPTTESKARNRKSVRRRIRASENVQGDSGSAVKNESGMTRQGKKVIPVDFRLKFDGEEDDADDDDPDDEYAVTRFEDENEAQVDGNTLHSNADYEDDDDKGSANPWKKTGGLRLTRNEYHRFCDAQLESYDLATQCPSRRASARKHTSRGYMASFVPFPGTSSVPHSRPQSRQHTVLNSESVMRVNLSPSPNSSPSLSPRPRERTLLKSHTTADPNYDGSNQTDNQKPSLGDMFLDERLSLTLEEIVHIRSVLTKAELESLPVEGRVKEDVEKRRVCFLCLKTRFGLLGPWGQRCRLCDRTVCVKCYSKMRIPTEHFAHVPVVLLSPGLLMSPSSSESDTTTRGLGFWPRPGGAVGSAPASPAHRRLDPALNNRTPLTTPNPDTPPDHVTPGLTPTSQGRRDDVIVVDRNRYPRVGGSPSRMTSSAVGNLGPGICNEQRLAADRMRGVSMVVCHDCRIMVIQIIKSSRTTRQTIRNNVISRLTLNLSPAYV